MLRAIFQASIQIGACNFIHLVELYLFEFISRCEDVVRYQLWKIDKVNEPAFEDTKKIFLNEFFLSLKISMNNKEI